MRFSRRLGLAVLVCGSTLPLAAAKTPAANAASIKIQAPNGKIFEVREGKESTGFIRKLADRLNGQVILCRVGQIPGAMPAPQKSLAPQEPRRPASPLPSGACEFTPSRFSPTPWDRESAKDGGRKGALTPPPASMTKPKAARPALLVSQRAVDFTPKPTEAVSNAPPAANMLLRPISPTLAPRPGSPFGAFKAKRPGTPTAGFSSLSSAPLPQSAKDSSQPTAATAEDNASST